MHVFWEGRRIVDLSDSGKTEKRMGNGIIKKHQKTDVTNRPLIISYSYSGNTHRIAQEICVATGGDWCEIYPWQPYPMAFPELLDQVRKEVQTEYRPRLLPGSSNPKPYQVIFAGSPNWCGTIAPPLASWLARNDLSGKIILPFYSHCGGVACDFRRDIARICPGADVREALGVIADSSTDWSEMLREWISEKILEE